VKELGRLRSSGDIKPIGLATVSGNEKAMLIPGHSDNDGFGSKYEVHLNVSSLNGCFFNFAFGSGSGSSFPFTKE
jgi:hypothetical protein